MNTDEDTIGYVFRLEVEVRGTHGDARRAWARGVEESGVDAAIVRVVVDDAGSSQPVAASLVELVARLQIVRQIERVLQPLAVTTTTASWSQPVTGAELKFEDETQDPS